MNIMNMLIRWAILAIFIASVAQGQTEPQWINIEDPDELRELVSGKAIGNKGWVEYFRADGNTAQLDYGSIAIRKWSINDNGKLCTAVYSLPDHTITCITFQRTTSDPAQYRIQFIIGEVRNFRVFDEPPKSLVDALVERTGSD